MRNAIDRLPRETREAMLHGIRTNPIVVGAYTDNQGGICPMLAAHRSGSRVDYLPFARSWDTFTHARRVRRATRREVRVLEQMLIASLGDPEDVDLGAAIAEHQQLRARTAAEYPEIKAQRLRKGDVARLRAQFDAELERAQG